LTNTATTTLPPADLLRFLRALGHAPEILDLPGEGHGNPGDGGAGPR
jgi:Ala-tRNA(Pro) deacylase